MKKILVLATLFVAICVTGCRITKSLTMMEAKNSAKLSEESFINKKLYGIAYLELSQEQKEKAFKVWKEEKNGLNMPLLKNENIAPIVYKSELDFRKILNDDQNKKYPLKKEYSNTTVEEHIPLFLNNKQLEEIKRIYLDKN